MIAKIAKIIYAIVLALAFLLVSGFAWAAGTLSLSQTSVYLNVGQNTTVTVYPSSNQAVNITSISDTYVAYANITNNLVTIYGLGAGSSQITLSTYDNYLATIAVTVGSGGGLLGVISFSQNNVSMNVDQSLSVNIYTNGAYYSNDNYYISNNSNANVVSASISGNTINLHGLSIGTSVIRINSGLNSNNYGTLYVTVSGNYNYGNLSFSQTNLNLMVGETKTIDVYNASGTLVVANNLYDNIASAWISGTRVNIYAKNSGSSTITISSQTGQTGTISVNVTGGSYSGNLYWINNNPAQATAGQSYSYQLQVAGGISPYNYGLYSGNLPPGLSLFTNGILSGTPSIAGNYNFIVRVIDSANQSLISNNLFLSVSSGQVAGINVYNNGTLINENGTIYMVYKNLKSGFSNWPAFQGLGYRLTNVISGNTWNLTNSGFIIGTAQTAHPWGSWIRQNQTIYFVHEWGLIPIANYQVFIANGGTDVALVPANAYDFLRPLLEVMALNDWRLK